MVCFRTFVFSAFLSRLSVSAETSTTWEVVRSVNTFQLQKNGEPFVIKGVCYSPAEINFTVDEQVNGSMVFGDLFTDPLPHYQLFDQSRLWESEAQSPHHHARGDLTKISQTLHANAIRVYFMQSRAFEMVMTPTGAAVKPPQDCRRQTHSLFLDEAHRNGLYVLVGLATPIHLFQQAVFESAHTVAPGLVEWWEFVMNETASDIGSHPAVLGFTILNELDDEPNAFPGQGDHPMPDNKSDFFHGQVVKYAQVVRSAAPGKLIGWALHDVPEWPGFASRAFPTRNTEYLTTSATYFAQVASVFDYFGVNTYHSDGLIKLLGAYGDHGELGAGGKAYGAPSLAADSKPVLLTEIGWPATTRSNLSDVAGPLVDDAASQGRVVEVMNRILPQAFDEYKSLSLGAFYFEYSDEWWKTPPELASDPNLAGPGHHDGGSACDNDGFPNKCNDEESFGLYSLAAAPDAYNTTDSINLLVERGYMIDALAAIYNSIPEPVLLTPAVSSSKQLPLSPLMPDPNESLFGQGWFLCLGLLCTLLSACALAELRRRRKGVCWEPKEDMDSYSALPM